MVEAEVVEARTVAKRRGHRGLHRAERAAREGVLGSVGRLDERAEQVVVRGLCQAAVHAREVEAREVAPLGVA